MGDNQYNKYSQNDYVPNAHHYQVKANVSGGGGVGGNGASQQFAYDVNSAYVSAQQPGSAAAAYESNTHLSSLSNCVKRLQTQLNTYLTKIIDEGSDGSTSNYNLGSGEVLNSHLMEQYASGGGGGGGLGGGGSGSGTPSAFGHHQHQHPQSSHHLDNTSPSAASAPGVNNGYSYYSNYPPNYPPPAPAASAYGGHHHHHQAGPPPPGMPPYGMSAAAAADYYNQQYSNFQEPKPKKQKNK